MDNDAQTRACTKGMKATREIAGILGAIVSGGLVLLLPTPVGLSVAGHRLAALFVATLILWSTEALPIAVTTIIILAFQPILGINTITTAIQSFMSPVFFFVLLMFIVALAWEKTGLARRFGLWMISKGGTDTRRVVFVFMIGTGVVSLIVSDVPCTTIFMALALSVLDKLNLRPGRSNFGRVLMLGIPIAALIGGVGTPAGSSINLLGLQMIEENGGVRIPFIHWMAIGIPMMIVLLPISAAVLLKFYPPEIRSIGNISDIYEDRRRLGPISSSEWKVIAIMSAMAILWILSSWFPAFNVYTVALCGTFAMFLPGIRLVSWKEAENAISWSTLMLIGGVTCLGTASSTSGLAKWLADTALTGIAGWDLATCLIVISAFTVVLHLMLPIAPVINAVMIPPIMALGAEAGVPATLYALPVIFTASCAFLFPLDSVPLVTYAKGYYRFFDMFPPGLIISIAWVVVMTAAMMLIGPILGLL